MSNNFKFYEENKTLKLRHFDLSAYACSYCLLILLGVVVGAACHSLGSSILKPEPLRTLGPLESEFDKWQNKLSMRRWMRGPPAIKMPLPSSCNCTATLSSAACVGKTPSGTHWRAPAVISSSSQAPKSGLVSNSHHPVGGCPLGVTRPSKIKTE